MLGLPRRAKASAFDERAGMDFTFVIPLRSAKVSSNWERVNRLLEATVGSALASRDANVRVVIACDEVPSIYQQNDPRVIFLSKAYPVPETSAHQMLDKRFKKFDLVNFVLRGGGGYMMLLDSDDLVSNKLASFTLDNDNRRGYLIDKGHILDVKSQEIETVADFDRRCGSSAIFYLDSADADSSFNWPLYITVTQHQDFSRLSKNTPRTLDPIPFAAAIALKNNGENHSYRFGGKGKVSIKRRAMNFLRRREARYLSVEAAQEFGMVGR
ncbi:hypothetical protein [Novosphingobium sp. 9U]|uniref:hypothetical protein n=1 Tax=Novosphingobium sp. 9U TaxID=2653158 RepID=UPI0012F02E15|nr:hypothetical protein [Novosphingobium sp. 9U]VWX48197.1 conserved hypothetical protein [Novosphingobium sp. 9U]